MNVSRFKIIDESLNPNDRYLINSEMGDKFFGAIENDTLLLFNWPEKNTKLNRHIYASPSASPLIATPYGYGIDNQSCFENIFIPSPSYVFDTETNTISRLGPKYNYDEYCDLISSEIENTIDDVYRQNQIVHLLFSGGSDSLTILSFIIKKKLLDRTVLVVNENYAVNTKNAIKQDDVRKQALNKLLNWLKPQCYDIHHHSTTKEELLTIINNEPLWIIKSYTSYIIFNRYQNSNLILGIKGNNTLLHRSAIAGQIMLSDSNKVWYDFSKSSKFYTSDLLNYDHINDRTPVYNRFFAKKSYPKLNGINNNTLVSPLGTEKIFNIFRQLDFYTVDLEVVADALMPRRIMNRNVGNIFDEYMIRENATEWDNMDNQLIDISLLNNDVLEIPQDLNHHILGIGWLENELDIVKRTGLINLNTILSLKNLQMISARFKNEFL